MMIRERMQTKEQEISGEWLTEEKMTKSGDFSKFSGNICINDRSRSSFMLCFTRFVSAAEAEHCGHYPVL